MRGTGPYAELLKTRFAAAARRLGLNLARNQLDTSRFTPPPTARKTSDDRQLSPTRFHNSVHNAPAGYWSIAARAMATSNVLCAHDGSFCAGLLESLCQVAVDRVPSLLIAYDTDYPEPLHAVRPIVDAFGVALVLAPGATERALARIDVQLTDAPATTLANAGFEALRTGNPAARALPLLDALAARRPARVVLDYLPDTRVQVDVAMPDGAAEHAQ